MSLSLVISLSIFRSTPSTFTQGWAPLFAVAHDLPFNLKKFGSLQELITEGFSNTSPAYLMASKWLSQNNAPKDFFIGKRANKFQQIVRLLPTITTEGFIYAFKVIKPDGTSLDISYVVPAMATVAGIVTGIAALISGSDITVTTSATYIQIAATAGKIFNIANIKTGFKIEDHTLDPGIVSDLNNIEELNANDWYGIFLDYGGNATILSAANWVQSRKKRYFFDVSDSDCFNNAITTDILSQLKALSLNRSAGFFKKDQIVGYQSVAWAGKLFGTIPGRANWSYQTIVGIAADDLTVSAQSAIRDKNGTYYTTIANEGNTIKGNSSDGDWIDLGWGIDSLEFQIQLAIYRAIKAASDRGEAIPYTDAGIEIITNEILKVLNRFVLSGFLTNSPAPTVKFPKLSEISEEDKNARKLPGGEFTAFLAGKINKIELKGYLSL